MIRKNIRTALRTLVKNKGISSINIAGLAIGMASVLLISQYIFFEKSYDRFFSNYGRIERLVFYRNYNTGLDISVGNNYYIGQISAEKIPDIEKFCRCRMETQYIEAGDKVFKETRTLFADSSFFKIFSHKILSGEKSEFLCAPDVAVITESTAKRYFGNEDAVGKIVYGINPGRKAIVIQGVIKDVPEESHLKFDFVVSLSTLTGNSYCYTCNNTNTYFLLREGADPVKIGNQITDFAKDYFAERNIAITFPYEYRLQPLTDIHLFSNYRFEHEINGNHKYLVILTIIAGLILISAGLNYYNLLSSTNLKRQNLTVIKIVNGASPRDIMSETMTETLLTGLISLFLALILLYISFPFIKNFLGLNFNIPSLFIIKTWSLPVLILVFLSLITGFLQAIRISDSALLSRTTNQPVTHGKPVRRYLVVGQFIISMVLVASTLGVMKQIKFMQEEAFKMDIAHTLVVKRPVAREFNPGQKTFIDALKNIPGVEDCTFSTISPGEKNNWVKGGIALTGKERLDYQVYQADIAANFFSFFGVKLLAGRFFFPDETNWNGSKRHLIINREALNAFGESNPESVIGKSIFDHDNKEELGEVVGVIDGYFQNSLDQEVKPTVFNCDEGGYYIFIKLNGQNLSESMHRIAASFGDNFKGQFYEYYFLDDFFNSQYKSHIQLFRCYILFSIIAIFITCLSLFGLVIMISAAKVREIGIRKINGAKISDILILLNREFFFWILIAFVVAVPLSWVSLKSWISTFAYKTTLSWWIFALAGIIAIVIALLTISWQSYRAATKNPVEALRYE